MNMTMSPFNSSDVLIVGAGPTGLVLATWLTRLGVRVRIIAKAAGPGTASRALVVQARTLELYQPLDLAVPVVAHGRAVSAMNLWAGGRRRARVALGTAGKSLTAYPYLEVFPQEEHEQLLVQRLADLGVTVQWSMELVDFTDHGTHVTARLRDSAGQEHSCQAAYVAGCDGAHSRVRAGLGLDFAGGTYPQTFYVADIEGSGPPLDGEGHMVSTEGDFLLILPMAGPKRARLVGVVAAADAATGAAPEAGDSGDASFQALSRRAIELTQLSVEKVNWFSSYHIHHRVAAAFRRGRVFLAGDAGHIHSPVGGQGMNTGIGDAINLAWKLAAVLGGQAGEELLATYEEERLSFARLLVKTTDQLFNIATASGPFAEFARARIAPVVMTLVGHHLPARVFRIVSQIQIEYRQGALSQGRAGRVRGGDRLPWVSTPDNYESLKSLTWQVHVYGTAPDGLAAWLREQAIPLHVFPWGREPAAAGLCADALYLVRPDGYVALADRSANTRMLERYLAARSLQPGRSGVRTGLPEAVAGDVARS
jgi:2-polyprenyl-6-methoxyphenol hydroxylase-like FAD-dependent oxidoreductase